MKIIINGEDKYFDEASFTVQELLEKLSIPISGTAVALNNKVVKKADHTETYIQENDRIEIVRAVAGG